MSPFLSYSAFLCRTCPYQLLLSIPIHYEHWLGDEVLVPWREHSGPMDTSPRKSEIPILSTGRPWIGPVVRLCPHLTAVNNLFWLFLPNIRIVCVHIGVWISVDPTQYYLQMVYGFLKIQSTGAPCRAHYFQESWVMLEFRQKREKSALNCSWISHHSTDVCTESRLIPRETSFSLKQFRKLYNCNLRHSFRISTTRRVMVIFPTSHSIDCFEDGLFGYCPDKVSFSLIL